MLLNDVILRLRATCPAFSKRVSGTQAFAAASAENAEIALPAAFVVPLYRRKVGQETGNVSSPEVDHHFAIIVAVDNTPRDKASGRMAAAATLDGAGRELEASLLGWTPATIPWGDEVRFIQDQHLHMDTARLWHQFEFCVRYRVSSNPDNANAELERLINCYFPDVDPTKIEHLFAGTPPISDPDDPHNSNYVELFHVIGGILPEWITHGSVALPQPVNPGSVMHGETLGVELPDAGA